ncbi:hypothetical protein [Aliagarivorans marinus]|uniref:hypothetical protein n=1 Tax=Aliagarivorans marinus TaxID=561965 RepID=UPI000406629D|nr:hypothetical protein [Aliagarivorans marinus]
MIKYTPLVLPLLLAGCGSSSGGSQEITGALSGKVIDGYVSGATVFLDLNNNGVMDANEPRAVSTDAGEYYLELTDNDQVCLNYVPIIVDVPVGAIDEDLGVVEEAYRLVLPPVMADVDHDSHITPLTSLAWDAMTVSLPDDYFKVGCSGIKNSTELHKKLLEALDKSTYDLGQMYNLSQDQIYGDFIASGDQEAHELAMKIVQGYQRSFRERADLIADDYNVWAYRYMYISGVPGYEHYNDYGYDWMLTGGYAKASSAKTHDTFALTTLYSADFGEEQQLYYRTGRSTGVEQDPNGAMHQYGTTLSYQFSSGYYCEREVNVETVWDEVDRDFTRYYRATAPMPVATPEDCVYEEFDVSETHTELAYRDRNNQDFLIAHYETFSSLINLEMSDFPAIKAEIESWNIGWYDNDDFDYSPAWWLKTLHEQEGEQAIRTTRNQDGYGEKVITNPDGTYVRLCAIDPAYPEFSEEACH